MKGIKGFTKGNKLGKANLGRIRGPLSDEQKQRLKIIASKRKELLGYNFSPETRKKIVEARRKNGYTLSLETRQKISLANKGKPKKPFTEEHKKNISKGKTGIKRSPEARKKISDGKKGKKNLATSLRLRGKYGAGTPNWKGGATPENKRARATLEYKLWRKSVFERDNYTCIWCGFSGYVEADHIKPFAHYPELRFAIDNGRTLCKSCHKTTNTYKGRSNKKKYV